MANPTWPATLPAFVLEQGFKENLPKQKVETQMDAGPPKARRRFTTNWRQFQCAIKMSPTQVATFETFYMTTLLGGTLAFDWVHPRTRAAATFRFRLPDPEYSSEGGSWVVAKFAMEQTA